MGFLSRCICAMGGYGGMGIERNMDMDVDRDMGWSTEGYWKGTCVCGVCWCVDACSRVYMEYVRVDYVCSTGRGKVSGC